MSLYFEKPSSVRELLAANKKCTVLLSFKINVTNLLGEKLRHRAVDLLATGVKNINL